MWIPSRLIEALISRAKRTPYFHLTDYMNRYWLVKPKGTLIKGSEGRKGIGIRIHEILRSDTDRHLHDHPWWNISIVLKGQYWEEMPIDQGMPGSLDEVEGMTRFKLRKAGSVVIRRASTRHRLILNDGPVTSLFIMGTPTQEWGFYTIDGKIYWRDYFAEAAEAYAAKKFNEENKNG